ncbi:MAG: hypothetical protein K0Q53_392 [Massilibacillus sp.]|jgi:L-lactate dehydrogenase complex protein LldG|nr:hypothetical protein [Massilibacillus sp.]
MKKVCSDWTKIFSQEFVNPIFWNDFELNAKAAHTEIIKVSNFEEAQMTIFNIIRSTKAKSIVAVGNEESTKIANIYNNLYNLGVQIYTDKFAIAENAPTADIGISTAEFAVGETGSVCVDCYSYESRVVGMLPPVHIVFLNCNNIVKNMTTAFKVISQGFKNGYMGFITGPSRTADIERVLSLGVHGPSRFIIIVVDVPAIGGMN